MVTKLMLAIFASCMIFCGVAQAEGKLGYSVRTEEGFWRVDVEEKESVREGIWRMSGGNYYLMAFRDGNRLKMPLAQNTNDGLDVVEYDEKHWWYRGFLWFSIMTHLDVYRDTKKGTLTMVGEIGDQMKFDYRTSISKKGKKSANFFFGQPGKPQRQLEIEFTSDKSPGSCKGVLRVELLEVGRFHCTSSGKLTDAFFNSPDDIFAFLVRFLAIPPDVR